MAPTTFQELSSELKQRHRTFRIIAKEQSPLMRAIFHLLGMRWWNPRFMEDYTTVLVTRVYMPRRLIGTADGYEVLRHEAVHIRDCLATGVLPFVLSYVLLLPTVLTFRAFWEYRGYRETMKVELERTGTVSDETIDWIARRFTGPDYLWMFPFPKLIRRMLRRTRDQLLAQSLYMWNS